MTAKKRTAKKAAPRKAAGSGVEVVIAYPWTDLDGTTHDPDSTVTVDAGTARVLIRDGQARPAATTTAPKE